MRELQITVLLAFSTILLPGVSAHALDAWRSVTTGSEPELAANEIQFLKVTGRNLWIGTLSGLTRYRDGTFAAASKITGEKRRDPNTGEWKTVETTEKADLRICSILETGKDSFLVGAAGGLFRMQDLVLGDVALKGLTVAPVLPFDDDRLWALAKNDGTGLSRLYGNTAGEWKIVEAFEDTALYDVVRTRDGRLWVLADGDGVFEVDPGEGEDKAVHHIAGFNVRTVMLDTQGRIWCGLWGRGAAAMDKDGTWQTHIEDEKSAVLAMVEDDAGNIWAGTSSGGLYRFDGREWNRKFVNEGAVSLLFADSRGRVWVSTQSRGGLRCYEKGTWRRSLDNRLPMTSMAEFDDALWAGGVLDGIHVLKEE
ncbi:MAG: hypothetical protein R6V03_02175 [Kiritimatiellia bacterium]